MIGRGGGFLLPSPYVPRYLPLFPYFQELSEVAFRVLADGFVTDDSGTGVVHCALRSERMTIACA